MKTRKASRLDLALAACCANCPLCRRARRQPSGLARTIVQRVETRVCPFCRAYERVYGRKAHEPVRTLRGRGAEENHGETRAKSGLANPQDGV
jgi:hypothetical protein